MTNPTNKAWLDQVYNLPMSDAIQAAEAALRTADTPEQEGAAEAALLSAMLLTMANELE